MKKFIEKGQEDMYYSCHIVCNATANIVHFYNVLNFSDTAPTGNSDSNFGGV